MTVNCGNPRSPALRYSGKNAVVTVKNASFAEILPGRVARGPWHELTAKAGANIIEFGVLNSCLQKLKAPCGDIVHGGQRAVWGENAV